MFSDLTWKKHFCSKKGGGGGGGGGGGAGDGAANPSALLQDEYQENSQRYIRNGRHIRKLSFIMILKKRYL